MAHRAMILCKGMTFGKRAKRLAGDCRSDLAGTCFMLAVDAHSWCAAQAFTRRQTGGPASRWTGVAARPVNRPGRRAANMDAIISIAPTNARHPGLAQAQAT